MNPFRAALRYRFRPDGFVVGLPLVALLAWIWPGPAAEGGILHGGLPTRIGVALVFFLHGIALSFDALKAGTLRWPVHLAVQTGTFLLFPLLGVTLVGVAHSWLEPDLVLGFIFLCCLPSTVSSSVVLTAAARGNVPVAVFNAAISSLMGVALTPLWMGLLARAAIGSSLPMAEVIQDLAQWLVIPLVAGQLCRRWWGEWVGGHSRMIHLLDRGTILLLVYASLSDSVGKGMWEGRGLNAVGCALLLAMVILTFALLYLWAVCGVAGFSREDRIAAIFCGSTKALTSGVTFGQLMFGAHPGLGMILLPIMLYHPLQLLVGSALASRWRHASTIPAKG